MITLSALIGQCLLNGVHKHKKLFLKDMITLSALIGQCLLNGIHKSSIEKQIKTNKVDNKFQKKYYKKCYKVL